MTQNDGHTSVLLDNVCKLIHQKVHAENVSLVEKFAKTLYSNMSKEDLANRNDSDLYGAALSLWNSLESHMSDDIMVRVVNPELAKHGWQSSHTIVEIIVKDMPFLVDSVRMALTRENIASHLLLHSPLKIQRNDDNKISALSNLKGEQASSSTKTVFFIEIDRQTDVKVIESLKLELDKFEVEKIPYKLKVPQIIGRFRVYKTEVYKINEIVLNQNNIKMFKENLISLVISYNALINMINITSKDILEKNTKE